MTSQRQLRWVAVGALGGGAAGAAWGWFGSGGYEAGDSAIGTGFLCAMAGALLSVLVLALLGWRARGNDRPPA